MSPLALDHRLALAALGAPPEPLHPLGFSSLQAGLYATLRALGVGPGSEVLCDPLFPFAALVVLHAGGQPRFPMLDDQGPVPRVEAWRAALRVGVEVIVATVPFGVDADVATLGDDAPLVLDLAHAMPAPVEHTGAAAVGFSFARGKPIDAGEGGLILFGSDELRNLAHAWACFGTLPDGAQQRGIPGLNLRPNPILPSLVVAGRARLEGLIDAVSAAGEELGLQLRHHGAQPLPRSQARCWQHPFLFPPRALPPGEIQADGILFKRCRLSFTGAEIAMESDAEVRWRAREMADRLYWYRPVLRPIWEEP